MKGLFVLFCVCLLASCHAQLILECPSAALIPPCQCLSSDIISIRCGGVQNGEQLAKSLSTGFQEPTELNLLEFQGSPITYLPPDVFRPVRSHVFTITDNANLSYVDEDAFAGSEDFIRVLYMSDNNLQGVDVFLAIGKMRGLNVARLTRNSLSTVPERAFAAMPDLAHVDLSYNRISSLGREAFADCPKLNSVILHNNELRVLPGRILAIDSVSVGMGDTTTLVLSGNQIEELQPDTFDAMERRVEILLDNNRLQTLPEIFQPVLDRMLEMGGVITLSGNTFVCDCRMRWLVMNSKYFKILKRIICDDTMKPLTEYEWFEIPC